MVAEGEVVITGRDLTIFASRARYHLDSKRLYLWGPVKILTSHGDWLKGRWARIDLRSGEGEIEEALLFIKKDRVQVRARKIKQVGERKYLAHQAIITTCDLTCEESPPWSFHVRRLEIRAGVAKARWVSFWVKRLPLAFSPLVSVPVKKTRKSGFLFPRLVQGSRTGWGVEQPVFLALHDSFDLTFYPLYTGKRGLLWGAEARYRLSYRQQGVVRYRYLRDRLRDEDYNGDGVVRGNRSRYWLTAKIDHALSSRTDLHLDLDLLSDRDFLEEFEGGDLGFQKSHANYLRWFGRGLEEKNKTYRTSRLWLSHQRDNSYLDLRSTYHRSVLPGRQKTMLSPLGSLHFWLLSRPLWGPLTFNLALENTYWYREEGARGLRAEILPEVIWNWPWGPLENALSYRFRYTHYWVDWDNGTREEKDRSLYEITWQSSLEIYRIYRSGDPERWGWRHTLRPYGIFFYRPRVDQDDLPEFVSTDRLPEARYLEYGLLQFLTVKRWEEGPRYWDFLRLKIYQRYDLRSGVSQPFSPLYAEVEFRSPSRFQLRYDLGYHLYGLGLTTQRLRLTTSSIFLDQFYLSYQRDKLRRVEQLTFGGRQRLFRKLILHGRLSRNLIRREITSSEIGLTYEGSCYSLDFTLSGTPEETRFSFWINLLGLGTWGKR